MWGLPCRWYYYQRGGLLPHPFTLTSGERSWALALRREPNSPGAVCFLLHWPYLLFEKQAPDVIRHTLIECSSPGRSGPLRDRRLKSSGHLPAYLVLLRVGFTVPLMLPSTRWALTPPFHPYLRSLARDELAVCFLLHWPYLLLEKQAPDVIRHTALRSSDFPPPRNIRCPTWRQQTRAAAIARPPAQLSVYASSKRPNRCGAVGSPTLSSAPSAPSPA